MEEENRGALLNTMVKQPYEKQYNRMITKILEGIDVTHGDVMVCFSGGKDSSLLLDMYCDIASNMFDIKNVIVGFANTTNESRNIREYVPWFIKRCEDVYGTHIDFQETRPTQTLADVFTKGLPLISKQVSGMIRKVSVDMEKCHIAYQDILPYYEQSVRSRDALREMGLSDTTILALTGWSCRRNDFGKDFRIAKKWLPALRMREEGIYLYEGCCDIVKKAPMARLGHPNKMTGEQAMESRNRAYEWIKHGCTRIEADSVKSTPFATVSPQTILRTIYERNVPLCDDYGKVILCGNNYACERCQRTGCVLCGFGIVYDPNRFVRAQKNEPAKIKWAFTPKHKGGAGYLEAVDFLNKNCGTNISIPKV